MRCDVLTVLGVVEDVPAVHNEPMNRPIRYIAVTLGSFATAHYLVTPYLAVDGPDAPPVASVTIVQSTGTVSPNGMIPTVFDTITEFEYVVTPPVDASKTMVSLPPTITVASLGAAISGIVTFKLLQSTST
jgi:hypothetical protein